MPNATNTATKNMVLNPSRREFAAVGAAAALWSGSAGAAPLGVVAKPAAVRSVNVQSRGVLFCPETGEHPGLVMFESLNCARSANAAVAQQLASQGWAVLLVETRATDDPEHITRDTRAHVDWLVAQPEVTAPKAQSATEGRSMHGFTLRGFSAAQPALSLASRNERQTAAASNVLFAAPGALLAKDQARRESLNGAARALYRRSA